MIGFIGAGNMGGAIIGGIVKNKLYFPKDVIAYDKNPDTLLKIEKLHGVATTTDTSFIPKCDVLFLAVKPQVIFSVIEEIKNLISADTIIVSIAAGKSIKNIEEAFSKEIKLVRVMPNTPALVGEGMSALTPNKNVTDEDLAKISDIFQSLGKAEIVPERLMDAVTAVSGSAPAYIFMMIEAMADAAVMAGMPRNQAYTFASQTVLGSAKMVLTTDTHPGELKDMVCSPGGTTIEAVKVLEEKGFRSAIIEAMEACVNKSKNM